MQIVPIPALSDNYIWLIRSGNEAVCVDPGEAAPVAAYLAQHGLVLRQIWITHHHHDHIDGIADLRRLFPECKVYGNDDIAAATDYVAEGSEVGFCGETARVWYVPGHTGRHLAYLLLLSGRYHVFCGDTLFSAGCGRVFTGTVAQLYGSMQRFNSLPADTLFYPAHEYTASNLCFAIHIEPDNQPAIEALALAEKSKPTLPVTLAHERRVNPFLRTGNAALAKRVEALSETVLNDEAEIFAALRALKNSF
ncbi:MAG: hydroxyacylglutathione hydrolase [Neisseria sp.]|uniref:hydroxyacylglutathione hydrolase n=1 Tax=Neisseria sp. TaxID=192066 RepID=UPI0026DD2B7B|nr:hydroxyacylglutathione hydrolase [Neisseria sp.]MDO4640110.1 hydroxyacylglutathione hydrolase [Neisseria sp.]